jgi:hypothetical protein
VSEDVVTNLCYSVGYFLGRVHTGMIAYLHGLWNQGKRGRLNLVLDRLISASLGEHSALRAGWEWKHIDLRAI